MVILSKLKIIILKILIKIYIKKYFIQIKVFK